MENNDYTLKKQALRTYIQAINFSPNLELFDETYHNYIKYMIANNFTYSQCRALYKRTINRRNELKVLQAWHEA